MNHRPWLVFRTGGSFLRLLGPFAYPAWVSNPGDATPMLRTIAAGWADVYNARPILAELFSIEGDVHVKEAPITERSPPTKRHGYHDLHARIGEDEVDLSGIMYGGD